MKKLMFYRIGTVLLLLTTSKAYAVKFDIKQGFVYEEQEIEQIKQKEQEEKLSKAYVKVLRLFNDDNKMTDPLLASNTQPADVKFLTINDSATHGEVDHGEVAREVATASANGGLDWTSIEKNLLELESQFGIRSMPVVQFSKIETLDKNAFKHRVEFLENKLGIKPESTSVSTIPIRLAAIKQKLNVETETIGFDVDLNM